MPSGSTGMHHLERIGESRLAALATDDQRHQAEQSGRRPGRHRKHRFGNTVQRQRRQMKGDGRLQRLPALRVQTGPQATQRRKCHRVGGKRLRAVNDNENDRQGDHPRSEHARYELHAPVLPRAGPAASPAVVTCGSLCRKPAEAGGRSRLATFA